MGLVNVVEVHCPEGCHSILLPDPIRDQRAKSRIGAAIHKFDLVAACPHCGLVTEFQNSVRSHLDRVPREQLTVRKPYAIAIIAVRPCGERNCEAHIKIQTLVASGLSIADIYPTIARWRFDIRCPRGHPVHPLPADSYQVERVDY